MTRNDPKLQSNIKSWLINETNIKQNIKQLINKT